MALCIEKFNRYSKVPIILLVIVSFLFLVCWTAPQAHAITMTVTVGIVLLCTALLAAFGVSITAPNNTSAIDYFTPKILAFAQSKGYCTISDWVAGETGRQPTLVSLFRLVGGAIVMDSPLWNCLLEYAKSFVTDENITSNGNSVGDLGTTASVTAVAVSGSFYNLASVVDGNTFAVTYTGKNYGTGHILRLYINLDGIVPNGNTFTLTPYRTWNVNYSAWNCPVYWARNTSEIYSNASPSSVTINQNNTYTFTKGNYPYLCIQYSVSGTEFPPNSRYPFVAGSPSLAFTINKPLTTPSGTVITPSATVIDPSTIGLGQNGTLTVPGIEDTMSPEDALNHIADKTATPGGLTASPSTVGYEIPEGSEWLYDQLNDINGHLSEQNPHIDWIPNDPLNFRLYDIWHYVTEWLQSWSEGLSTFLTVNNLSIPSQFVGVFYGVFVAAVVIGLWRRFFE